MNHILDKLNNGKILIVGDIMLDRYWWGEVSRISPEAPVPVVRLRRTSLAAGGAANVAANVAGLGAEPLLFGVVGKDHEADQVRDVLKALNVSCGNIIATDDRPTTVKTRVIAHSQQVTRIDNETDDGLSVETENALADSVAKAIANADAIVISDYAKGLLTDGVLEKVIAAASNAGKPLLVDPKGKDYTRYRGAAMITPNRREAAEACNFHENGDVVERAGAKLIADLGIDAALITQGEDGMTLFRKGREPVTFATAAREVYDVTGAGDTVIATLATAVAAGADLETATNLANIAAGIVVEQVGTSAIDITELRRAAADLGSFELNALQLDRILIFRIGHLGDTVVALPALWALRETYPDAHLTLLSNADAKNPHYISPDRVLPHEGLIDEFLAYPTNRGTAATVAATLRLGAQLRSKNFDAVVYLMPRARTLEQIERDTRFFRLAGIDRIFGVNYLRETRLDEPIPIPTPEIASEADHLVQCMIFDGLVQPRPKVNTDLLLTAAETAAAESWLTSAAGGALSKAKLVGIAPGSKWGSKVWPENRFAAVVDRLVSDFGVYPIVFGGPEDREKGDRLVAGWNQSANAAGELSVRESAALLRRCRMYLGNDTGTMHLAAAVGTPCVAIFAAIDWVGKWTPFGDNNRVFRKRVECEGCHTPDCFNKHKCLELVTVDEVYGGMRGDTKSVKKVLVIGGKGMLGHKLVERLGDRFDVWATLHGSFADVERYGIFDRRRILENIDVTDTASVRRSIETSQPDVIISAVGVVKQSPAAADVVNTLRINSIFPHQLADVAKSFGSRLILISTDCVFDGKKGNYREDDVADALDLYGQSKHLGEVTADNCLTLRTSIIGRELAGEHSLIEWFLSNRGKTVKGFVNAIYSGFPTIVFADIISSLVTEHEGLTGLYHVSSERIDKYSLLKLVNDAYAAGITVEPSEEFRINRSLDSTKFREATGFEPATWESMIERMANDPTPYDTLRQ